MENIIKLVMYYFVAFGIVFGGSIFGGIGAFLVRQPPMSTMYNLSDQLKVWATIVAIGGTFDSIIVFESGIFRGNFHSLLKQILFIAIALVGAYTGQLVIQWLVKGDIN